MRNKLLPLLFIIVICGCTSPKYFAERRSDMVTLDLDKSITNYIPIPDEDLKNSKILNASYDMITHKKYSKLESYINSLEKLGIHTPDVYLSKTLLFITQKDYQKATQSLWNIKDTDYSLLKRLLTTDLTYELTKMNGALDFNKLLKDYQDLVDAYPDDIPLKKIVSIRLRYLRYNY